MKKPVKKRLDCIGMGIIPFDLLFEVKRYPKSEMKIDAESFFMQGGGPVPNVMVGLSRLGFKTSMIAAVGDDPFGKMIVDELKKDRVDVTNFIIKKKPSALAAGFVEQGTGKRTLVLAREVFIEPKDLNLKKLPQAKIIHLDGRDMPATMKLARWAKKNGVIVSFDIGSIRNDVSEVFPLVDHLVVADQFAFGFTKSRNAENAIKKLAQYCPGTIIVTEGIKGSYGWEPEKDNLVYQKAYKVENVDTTGAGDCFHTGYLYGLLKGYNLRERMNLGSAAAALKCTKPGARSGIPQKNQLMKFLKSNPETY